MGEKVMKIESINPDALGTVIISDVGYGRQVQEIHGGEFDGSIRVIESGLGKLTLEGLKIEDGLLVGYGYD